jgi:hypothetical protein
MDPKAAVVKLEVGTATTGLCARMPTIADIFACQTTDTLGALPTPNKNGLINFKGLKMFVPAPFLCNPVMEAMTSCPFALIIASTEAYNAHIQEHANNKDLYANDISTHCNIFIFWCMGVAQGTIPQTRFSVLPDNEDFKTHTSRLHQECIIPTLTAAAAAPANQGDTIDVLRQLGANMARSSKATKA